MKMTMLVLLVALTAGCGDGNSDDPGNIRGQAGDGGAAGSTGGSAGAQGAGGVISSAGGHFGAGGAAGAAAGEAGGMSGTGGAMSTGGSTGAGGSIGGIAICDPKTGYVPSISSDCYDDVGQLQHHAGFTCQMCGSLLGPGQYCRNVVGGVCVRLCSDCI